MAKSGKGHAEEQEPLRTSSEWVGFASVVVVGCSDGVEHREARLALLLAHSVIHVRRRC